jgi:hypothetical protein
VRTGAAASRIQACPAAGFSAARAARHRLIGAVPEGGFQVVAAKGHELGDGVLLKKHWNKYNLGKYISQTPRR